jgi:glycosyltransferase involved in cell wall biosynthesis
MERLEKSYVRKDKLKILFAGALSQRKGLADLFQAIKLLNSNRVELVLLGSPILSMDFYRKQYSDFTYEAVRPNREVLELMKSCDLFVFPSIVEGRAQVQQEAMSVGLPVIATKNAGADDLIEDGQSGFIVPIRDSQTLAEKINYFIENPDKLEEMGKYAYLKAQRLSWTSYQEKILNAMDEFMAGKF